MMVITSDTYPATRNSKAQKKIYRPHEDKSKLVVWYSGGYKGLNSKYSYDPVSRDLVLNCSDDSRSMGLKTIMAFEWALENVEFEYIIRPTPSSYINFPYLRKLYGEKFFNQKFLYAGTVQNIEYQDKPNLQFVSGSTLILNKPCVELIVENQDKWDHDLWDDLALSKVMHELNIKPLDIKRFNIEGNIFRQEIDLKNYQFRCRADTHFNYPRYIEAHLLKIISKLVNNTYIHPIQKIIYYYYFELLKTIYIREFSWKLYLKIRKVLKRILPSLVYNKVKMIFSKKIIKFQYKRFKY
jgi:hypothetical protein